MGEIARPWPGTHCLMGFSLEQSVAGSLRWAGICEDEDVSTPPLQRSCYPKKLLGIRAKASKSLTGRAEASGLDQAA